MIKIYSTQKNAVSLYFETMKTIILIRILLDYKVEIGREHVGCEQTLGVNMQGAKVKGGEHEWVRT